MMMNMTSLSALFLALFVLATCGSSGAAESSNGMASGVRDRSLSSTEWSFANMMYHLNACPKPEHCPGGPIVSPLHPCGCPDCSKPHPNDPNFAHGYCYVAPTTSSVEESYDETSYTNSTDTTSSQGSSQNGTPSSANWVFSPLLYIAGAAVVAMGAVGIVMRKRKNRSEQLLDLDDEIDDDDDEPKSAFAGVSRGFGMLAASGAGLAAAMGFGKRRGFGHGSGASVGDLSGSVARRMRSMEAGDDDSSPYYREADAPPMFVSVPADGTYAPGPSLVEHDESVEVEGPYRPSSYSACV